MLQGSTGAEDALRAVGKILEAERQCAAIVIVGGTALNMLGLIDRATRDVDVIALGEPPTADRPTPTEATDGLP